MKRQKIHKPNNNLSSDTILMIILTTSLIDVISSNDTNNCKSVS